MKIGRRIYYDLLTGEALVDTGEREGDVIQKSVDQDITTFKVLSERSRESFDFLELTFGQYTQDFAECSRFKVNVHTKQLDFSYPDPNAPEIEKPYQAPLSEQVKGLEQQNTTLKLAIAELAEAQEQDKLNTQLALAELAETLLGGV